jgi:PST family polysaccharide transporter
MTLRTVAWPMCFIVLAKGAQKLFLCTEVAAGIVHVGLAWLCVSKFGLSGAGAAFFGLYVWHAILIYFVVRRLTGFRWSAENRSLLQRLFPLIGLIFCCHYLVPFWLVTAIGGIAVLISGIYSIRVLLHLAPTDELALPLRRLLGRIRLLPLMHKA